MASDPVLVAKNTAAWLRKAVQDLARVGRCLATEPPDIEDALFHCQQCAEKALKTFLTWHDRPFRKTHDLSVLAAQCLEIDPTIQPYVDRLDDLTEYAWAFRYPTTFVEPPPADVEIANGLAHEILDEIKARLPLEVHQAAGLALKRDDDADTTLP